MKLKLSICMLGILMLSLTLKKPKKQETRMAHPIAYEVYDDSVRVYLIWADSISNKIYSADTSIMYHKSNTPDFKNVINVKLK